jgi:hypothetical protein
VAVEMGAMAPDTVHLHIFPWSKKLTKYVRDGQPEKVMQLDKCNKKE